MSTTPQPPRQRNGWKHSISMTVTQVKALVKKDFQTIKYGKKKALCELLIPILIGCTLLGINGMSGSTDTGGGPCPGGRYMGPSGDPSDAFLSPDHCGGVPTVETLCETSEFKRISNNYYSDNRYVFLVMPPSAVDTFAAAMPGGTGCGMGRTTAETIHVMRDSSELFSESKPLLMNNITYVVPVSTLHHMDTVANNISSTFSSNPSGNLSVQPSVAPSFGVVLKATNDTTNSNPTWTFRPYTYSTYYSNGGLSNSAAILANAAVNQQPSRPGSNNYFIAASPGPGAIFSKAYSNLENGLLIGVILPVCLFFMVITTVGRLIAEKKSGVREHLRIMGLSQVSYAVSAAITAMLRVIVCVCILAPFIALSRAGIPVSIWATALYFLFLFGLTLGTFSHVVAALTTNSILASAVMTLFLFLASISPLFIGFIPTGGQVACAVFFSPVSFMYGVLGVFGGKGAALAVSPAGAWACLVFQSVFYLAVGEYLHAIRPGQYGVPAHLLFPLHSLVNMLSGACRRKSDETDASRWDRNNDAVVVAGLVKSFDGGDTYAVNGASITLKRGEILGLLGHNGAGKTTTINILTGMIPATRYQTCTVDGYDVKTQTTQVRERISCCPQFDVLFDALTGKQHMDFYRSVRGNSHYDDQSGGRRRTFWGDEPERLLEALQLPTDNAKVSHMYSGGMKRRLSVACALVTDSPVMFLDEPSSGLDPVNRRKLWDLLKQESRSGRSIVLTTHFMEEAEYLSDRISIMSRGKVYCTGTAAQLKSTYSEGYFLTLAKSTSSASEKKFESEAVLSIIRQHIPNVKVHSDNTGDFTVLLPTASVDRFADVLEEIEAKTTELCVSSIGISMNSLEDVFVGIAQKEAVSDKHMGTGAATVEMTSSDKHDMLRTAEERFSMVSHCFLTRVLALVMTVLHKRFLVSKRSVQAFLWSFLLPTALGSGAWFSLYVINNNGGMGTTETSFPDMRRHSVLVAVPEAADPSVTRAKAEEVAADFLTLYSAYAKEYLKIADATLDTVVVYRNDVSINGDLFPVHDPSKIAFSRYLGWAPFAVALTNMTDVQTTSSSTHTDHYVSYHSGAALDAGLSPGYLALMDAIFQASIQKQAVPPAVLIELPEIDPNAGNPFASEDENFSLLITLGPMLMLGLALIITVSVNTISIVGEIQRLTFHSMRMQGLSAGAYWVGTLLGDLLLFLPVLVGAAICERLQTTAPVLHSTELIMQYTSLIPFFFLTVQAWAYLIAAVLMSKTAMHPVKFILMVFLIVMIPPVIILIINIFIIKKGAMKSFLSYPSGAFAVAFPTPHADVNTSEMYIEAIGQHGFRGPYETLSVWFLTALAGIACWCYRVSLASLCSDSGHSSADAHIIGTSGNRSVNDGEMSSLLQSSPSEVATYNTDEDEDVSAERNRVLRSPQDNMTFALRLQKFFGVFHKEKVVKDLTFGVRPGECFGLLGPNGAGKTTTCKMMLYELAKSRGEIEYPQAGPKGASRWLDTKFVHTRLGVCQQVNTLWDELTAEEHMQIALKSRLGWAYRASEWKAYIATVLDAVELKSRGNKRSSEFSGGMKRKLQVAMAMYCGAVCSFLDEPSTGMDPFARRALWKTIQDALQEDRCVLLTTHSMDEAEAVCARIGIVTKGSMRCIGSSQHLKTKFGAGYSITVEASLGDEAEADISQWDKKILSQMQKVFGSGCKLVESIGLQRRFAVPRIEALSTAFRTLKESQTEWQIGFYAVSEDSSLEQIFVTVAED